MVKGRRLRSLVACTKQEAFAMKRKKEITVNMTESLTTKPTIKSFFQTMDNNADDQDGIKVGDVAPKTNEIVISNGYGETLVESSTTTTTTPHRIELRNETTDVIINKTDVVEIDLICLSPKNGAPPKSRRKLNLDNGTPAINHKLTEYFPVRRSIRKTKKTVLEEQQRCLEHLIRNNIEDDLKIKVFDDKGRGVITNRLFERGDFVVEYSGELIDNTEAKRREFIYAQDRTKGCYMYYFKHGNQQYCIDATAETGRLGRLVNHSRNGNLLTRSINVDNKPRLILVAKETITAGTEVTYDYGDRSKESLRHHPWLAN